MTSPRVLVVDDDDTARDALVRGMESIGCRVASAADGPTAIELLERVLDEGGSFDVILLDVIMPGFSGLGVAEIVRPLVPDALMVLVTGFTDDSLRIVARRLGVSTIVRKPVELDEVLGLVLSHAGLEERAVR